MDNSKEIRLIHDNECLSCEKLFDCSGKPVDIKSCLSYESRKAKEYIN